jgi:outer membrane protein assembly factor BamD
MRGTSKLMFSRAIPVVVAVALPLLGGACSRFQPRNYPEPEQLYVASMREFRAGNFTRAQAGFQALLFNVTARDTLLPRARFYLAECQFGSSDFAGAAREFRRMADDFPSSPLAPQALLRAGDAHAAMWRRSELDPTQGHTALATYTELAGRYPGVPAARMASLRVRDLNELLARKEFQAADYYFRRGAYESSILYLRSLIAQYPSTSVVPEAFVRLVRAYGAIDYREERAETCAHLRQFYGTRRDVRELCADGNTGR